MCFTVAVERVFEGWSITVTGGALLTRRPADIEHDVHCPAVHIHLSGALCAHEACSVGLRPHQLLLSTMHAH